MMLYTNQFVNMYHKQLDGKALPSHMGSGFFSELTDQGCVAKSGFEEYAGAKVSENQQENAWKMVREILKNKDKNTQDDVNVLKDNLHLISQNQVQNLANALSGTSASFLVSNNTLENRQHVYYMLKQSIDEAIGEANGDIKAALEGIKKDLPSYETNLSLVDSSKISDDLKALLSNSNSVDTLKTAVKENRDQVSKVHSILDKNVDVTDLTEKHGVGTVNELSQLGEKLAGKDEQKAYSKRDYIILALAAIMIVVLSPVVGMVFATGAVSSLTSYIYGLINHQEKKELGAISEQLQTNGQILAQERSGSFVEKVKESSTNDNRLDQGGFIVK